MGIEPHLRRGGCLMGFLEMWLETGVYSGVTAGWTFETPLFSAKSGLLFNYDEQLKKLN